MDYNEWGIQYLDEAQRLKERLTSLRQQARKEKSQAADKLYRRIAALNDMYLDCLHTGKYLVECGGHK